MNRRRKVKLVLSFFWVGALGFALACGSLSPYPPEDNNQYPAGFQVGGISQGGSGGTGEGGPVCFIDEAGIICLDSGNPLPDVVTPPPCTGCSIVARAAGGLSSVQSITLDPGNVYWTESNGNPWIGTPQVGATGLVRTIARPGGSLLTPNTLASGLAGPFILKLGGGGATLAFSSIAGTVAGSVQTVPTSGGTAATPGPALNVPFGVAADSTNVYWVSSDSMIVDVIAASAPLGGGAVSTLGVSTTALLAQCVAVNSSSIYFTALVPGLGGTPGVYQLPITGGVPNLIWSTSAPTQPADITLDGANIYWTDTAGGSVYSMPLTGGAAQTLASGMSNPRTIARDSKNVYFTADTGIFEVPIGGSSPTMLAPEPVGSQSYAIAADDNDNLVYFSITSPPEILAVGK
jgi:hypothetical protein